MENELKQVEVGELVVFLDANRVQHNALLTAVWGEHRIGNGFDGKPYESWPCVNLVFVVSTDDKQDQYGRQIQRETSVSHFAGSQAPGMYWFYTDQQQQELEHRAKCEQGLKR